jgi:ornithine cyclodeaminase
VLILNGADTLAALDMASCIEAMEAALKAFANGELLQPPRTQVRLPGAPSLLGLMPAFKTSMPALWGTKTIVVAPGNRARGLDSHQGGVILNDGETGELLAVVDATAITAIRTAAVSAVATRVLARHDSAVIAMIGAGHQAIAHVAAMRVVLPQSRIVVAARSPETSAAFAHAHGVEPAPSVQAAVEQADVICTLTTSSEPILDRTWIRRGTHINAVGTSSPDARELPAELIRDSLFYVDSRSQAEVECGEYRLALQDGRIGPAHIRAELGQVLAGSSVGRQSGDDITIFKSLGLAVEDLAAAHLAVLNAEARGLGVHVDW